MADQRGGGLLDVYRQHVGDPFASLLGGALRGVLGLEKATYVNDDAYRAGQALGNMPGIGAPAGVVKAAMNAPDALVAMGGLLGKVGVVPGAVSVVNKARRGDAIADALRAKYPDVKLDLSGDDKLYLGKIVVPKDKRSQGIGSSVMGDLVKQADEAGVPVSLSPSSDFGGSVGRLKEFYKRFGFVENKGRNKDFSISESMYRQPVASAAKATYAPQDEALETARKNAVKMLGLPENNTAMDRAKAMGFQESGYSGTARDIKSYDPTKAAGAGSGSREGALGAWLTDDPRVASGFADWSARGQGGNVVYPLVIRGDKPFEASSYSDIKDVLDANTKFARPPYRMMQDKIDYESAKRALSEKGDYVALRNTQTDSIDKPITQFLVTDPSRIRSRFAAFDPARVNENDLLGNADPRLLALIAAGTGGGLLGYNYLGNNQGK